MEATTRQILGSVDMVNRMKGMKLPFIMSFKLAAIVEESSIILKNFDDTRIKILEEYSAKDDDGNPILRYYGKDGKPQPTPEGATRSEYQLEDLAGMKVELDKILGTSHELKAKPITLKEAEPVGDFSSDDLAQIMWMIKG